MEKEIELSKLKPYANNPRNNDNAVAAVAESIKQCGYIAPIIVDENMEVLAGHTRLRALKKLNYDKATVRVIEGLTEEQKRKYRLLDNKTNELAEWDMEKLTEELNGLDFGDFDFGFDFAEPLETDPPEITEDEPDLLPPDQPKAQPGQVWKLGEHRLMCGDSTSAEDVKKLLGGAVADMVFTDPPYGMKKEADGVANDNLNFDDLLIFNKKWIALAFENLKDCGAFYCWGIDEPLMDIYSEILKPMKRRGECVIGNYITWVKHSAIGVNSELNTMYPEESEKCWYIVKGHDWRNNNADFFNEKYAPVLEYLAGEAQRVNITNKDLKKICGCAMYSHWFTKSQFAIITEEHYKELAAAYPGSFTKPYKELRALLGEDTVLKPYFDATALEDFGGIGLTDVWRINQLQGQEREEAGGHATPKPIALCARAINASSRKGETILDLFGGSGSTLIACEQLGRRACLMELEPKWVDVIIKRWEKHTGKKAELVEG